MNISVPATAKAPEIVQLVRSANADDCLLCHQERQYSLIKIALVKLQRPDLNVELYAQDGRLLKQLSAKTKAGEAVEEGLSRDQIKAIKQLEQAFQECFANRLNVIGFSDGLVAVPIEAGVSLAALSSSDAMDVDTMDVYKGYEADEE